MLNMRYVQSGAGHVSLAIGNMSARNRRASDLPRDVLHPHGLGYYIKNKAAVKVKVMVPTAVKGD